MKSGTGVGTGLLLAVLGLWLVLRTVNTDSTGRTLIDYLTGAAAAPGAVGAAETAVKLSTPWATLAQAATPTGLATPPASLESDVQDTKTGETGALVTWMQTHGWSKAQIQSFVSSVY
jgi:hypothetical protein